MFDGKQFGREMTEVVRGFVEKATAPLLERIAALEAQVPQKGDPGEQGDKGEDGLAGQDGRDGVDGVGLAGALIDRDGKLILTLTDGTTRDLGNVIGKDGTDGKDGRDGVDGERGEKGQDGKDADMGLIDKQLQDLVAAIPVPKDGIDGKDGKDGQDADMEVLRGHLNELVAAIPAPKDGQDGRDGIDGKDADMDELRGHLDELVKAIPVPQDGKDGQDAYPGEAKGLYDPAAEYRALDVVSYNGSEWRAKVDNPGDLPGDGWMLSASKGKRGDRGDRGEKGLPGTAGKDGAQPIAIAFDEKDMKFQMVLDDGNALEADFYPVAKAIRGE